MNRDQIRINYIVLEIAFIKSLFKDAIAKGFPHLWDGNEDLYKWKDFQVLLNEKRNEERKFEGAT